MRLRLLVSLAVLTLLFSPSARAQSVSSQGTLEHITVHGRLLEGNLEGDSPDRPVDVYLPPSYSSGGRRYPVVYLLHGFTGHAADWNRSPDPQQHVVNLVDRAIANGSAREMIVVMPDAHTRFGGSFYSQSVTTGDWEDFIATELVAYIDSHYRTIPNAESRGLAGHSMGGYGTLRIGIRHPDVFSSIYALSPCCTIWGGELLPGGAKGSKAESIHTDAQVRTADFNSLAALALSAAWSPDPKARPFFLDLPTREGVVLQTITAKWSANMPVATLDQHVGNLKRLHAIAFDVGRQDEFAHIPIGARALDKELTNYGIPHTFEMYEGTHVSRIPERIETRVLPFFSKNLAGQ